MYISIPTATVLIIFVLLLFVVLLKHFSTKCKEFKKISDEQLRRLHIQEADIKQYVTTIQEQSRKGANDNKLYQEAIYKKDELYKSLMQKSKDDYTSSIKEKDELYKKANENKIDGYGIISSLLADHLTLQYEISAKYLENKKHPALEEAKRIRELREQVKNIIQRDKIIQYKYEYLFQLFPDLKLYVDDPDLLAELSNASSAIEACENLDKTRNYLTKEEYASLGECERNQLALERYIKSQKTKWQIGRDYELYVGYKYRQDGWTVEQYGIEKQLDDLGRDIIATKLGETHIIQCKYWAQYKQIHENHIAQLYGTTIQYKLSSGIRTPIIPVFVTNIRLSETARQFADYLHVKVIDTLEISEFPRVKCNINQDEFGFATKIYHLPMDQQYDRTKINKDGEFYAFTVDDAVRAGFRRARRWLGNE